MNSRLKISDKNAGRLFILSIGALCGCLAVLLREQLCAGIAANYISSLFTFLFLSPSGLLQVLVKRSWAQNPYNLEWRIVDWRLTSWSLVVLNLVLLQSILFRPRLFVFPVLMVDENFQTEPSFLLHLQSEVNGFADFHLYVCAAFLKRFSVDVLKEEDFQVRTDQLQKYFQEHLVAVYFLKINICMLTHVHTYAQTHTHSHTHTHTHTRTHTHTHIHVCGGVHPVRRGGTTEHWLRTDIKSANKLTKGMPTTVHVLLQSADH